MERHSGYAALIEKPIVPSQTLIQDNRAAGCQSRLIDCETNTEAINECLYEKEQSAAPQQSERTIYRKGGAGS